MNNHTLSLMEPPADFEPKTAVLIPSADTRLLEHLKAEGYEFVIVEMPEALRQRRPVYTSPDLYVNFRTAEVTRDGQRVELTALELHLLEYFVEHPGEVLSREELLDKVWGYDASPITRTVDVRIAALRRKLERNPSQPELILTIHRFGYKFVGS
jgi:DNA-binding response OmpR family regulator